MNVEEHIERTRACPLCKAPAGERCHTVRPYRFRTAMTDTHLARVNAPPDRAPATR